MREFHLRYMKWFPVRYVHLKIQILFKDFFILNNLETFLKSSFGKIGGLASGLRFAESNRA